MQADVWFGVYAPRGTPAEITAALNKTIVGAIKTPEMNERMIKLGLRPTGTSSTELARIQKADFERWGPIVKASGFRPSQWADAVLLAQAPAPSLPARSNPGNLP